MKIRTNTSNRLVITRSSVLDRLFFSASIAVGIAVLFFGDALDAPFWARLSFFALFLSGGVFFWLMSAKVTVTLNGPEGEVRVHWSRIIGERTRSARLDKIVALRAQKGDDAGRLRFHFQDGSIIPLAPYSYSGGSHPQVVETVNAWLANWTQETT